MMEETPTNKSKTPLIATAVMVVLVVLGLVVWWVMQGDDEGDTTQQANNSQTATQEQADTTPATPDGEAATVDTEIVFTDDGFGKSTYTLKVGEAVEVRNDSSQTLQFSSDDHPTHTENSELNLATLEPGQTQQFTPTQSGTWGVHDHLDSSKTTTVVVVE